MDDDYPNLTDYEKGYLEGLEQFAWWREGEMQVGTTGTTLAQAKRRYLASCGYGPVAIAHHVPETPAERWRREKDGK